MSLFKVALKRGACDPKSWKNQADCRIVSRNSAFLSTDLVLIDATSSAAENIGQVPGVFKVVPVSNESFIGDDGWVLTIRDGSIADRSKHRT